MSQINKTLIAFDELRLLENELGSEALNSILQVFWQELKDDNSAFLVAESTHEYSQANALAHKLKSACRSFGFIALGDHYDALERHYACESSPFPNNQLTDLVERSQALLSQIIAQGLSDGA